MPAITLSSKHQITLPVEIVRDLQLKAGDKLVAELIDDHIVILRQPESWTDHFRGSMKGVYGSTLEEIDAYVAQERTSPERWEWREQFCDMLATNEAMAKVVEILKSFKGFVAAPSELWAKLEKKQIYRKKDFDDALKKLIHHGGVRKIEMPQNSTFTEKCRLVHELAEDNLDSR